MVTAHSAAAQAHHQAAQAAAQAHHQALQAVPPQVVTALDAEKVAAGNGVAILQATGQTIAHAHGMKLIVIPTELANAAELMAAQLQQPTQIQAQALLPQ